MTFKTEKDWTTQAGLRAVVVIHPAGHRCGYVGVPAGNKYHGKEYDDVPADVHGGLTYAGGSGDYPAPAEGLWWLGYDCAHLGDANDPELMQGEYKEIFMRRGQIGCEGDSVKSLDYCVQECESLANQLIEVAVTPPEATMSEYIKGFDAGYDYVLNEIERFMRETTESDAVIRPLLKHLRMEGKPQ